ncbi:MAG: bacillithiol system redox-active protein YtxJ [Acidobacteriota bacterium]
MRQNLKELNSIADLDTAIAESSERPVLLFKHSLTCPISARAFREFEAFLEEAEAGAEYKLIIVQTSREVSNEAAARLGLRHESPQAMIVHRGREVWNTSHFDITAERLREAVRSFRE